jgi:hypothetical protein
VAKLVDAPSSGGGVRKDVLVRIQSRAQNQMRQKLNLITLGVTDFQKQLAFTNMDLAGKSLPSAWTTNSFPLGGVVLALYPKNPILSIFKIPRSNFLNFVMNRDGV